MSLRSPFVPLVFSVAALPLSAAADTTTVPRGAVVAVQLERSLRSEDLRAGDSFTATVLDPVYVDGRTAIAAGSVVGGVVTVVRSRAQGHRSGVIGLHFVRLQAPDGGIYTIDGGLIGFRRHPTPEGDRATLKTGARRAVVVIGTEADGPGKQPSSLVGDAGEDESALADRWSHSGLGPELAEIDAGAELRFELRKPLQVERPLIEK
jgi:hypothetical protein